MQFIKINFYLLIILYVVCSAYDCASIYTMAIRDQGKPCTIIPWDQTQVFRVLIKGLYIVNHLADFIALF